MRSYPKYKPSQVDFLDEVPSDWEVRRLASFGRFSKGGGISKSDLVENGIPVILYGDIYTKYNLKAENIFNFISQDLVANSKRIYKGDLLFTGSGETREDIGKCIVYNGISEVYAGSDTIIFSQKTNDSLFLAYSLGSNYAITKKAMNSKGDIIVHIYASSLRDIYLPIPPLSEQQQITNFLDYKTEQCDRFIANRQKQIELLNEQRNSIINKAILNGLDEKIEFKQYENIFVNKLPKHWKLSSVKRELMIQNIEQQDGNHGELHPVATDYSDNGIPFVLASDVNNYEVDLINCKKIPEDIAKKLRIGFSKTGDILLTHKGTIGRVGICNTKKYPYIILTPQVTYYRIKRDYLPKYIFYQFQSNVFIEQLKLLSGGGSTRDYVGIVAQRELKLIKPPIEEQKELIEYIEKETSTIETLISKYQKQIDLMQEYRTALISQAVTGKIDVREWKPPTK